MGIGEDGACAVEGQARATRNRIATKRTLCMFVVRGGRSEDVVVKHYYCQSRKDFRILMSQSTGFDIFG